MNDIKFIIADYSSHFDNYETFINVLKCKLQCLHSKQLVYHGTNDPAESQGPLWCLYDCDIYINFFFQIPTFFILIFIKFLSEFFC